MTTLPTLTKYSGAIPNKATMDKNTFANAVHPYLNWWNDYIPTLEDWATKLQILSTELQTLATDTENLRNEAETFKNEAQQARDEAIGAVSTLPDGTINDNIISEADTWSSVKINNEIENAVDIILKYEKESITSIDYTDDKITQINLTNNRKVVYSYTNNLITKEEYFSGSTKELTITYTYDSNNNLISATRS